MAKRRRRKRAARKLGELLGWQGDQEANKGWPAEGEKKGRSRELKKEGVDRRRRRKERVDDLEEEKRKGGLEKKE